MSGVTRNQPLQRGGSGFVSPWTGHKDRLVSCINRLGGEGGGGTIDVHIWGSFVLKPQKQVTRCLTNTHTHTLQSHTSKHSDRTKDTEGLNLSRLFRPLSENISSLRLKVDHFCTGECHENSYLKKIYKRNVTTCCL